MKIEYTPQASLELKRFQDSQRKLLEEAVVNKKVVFGDDVVEITAADIKEVEANLAPPRYPQDERRFLVVKAVAQIYMALGATCTVAAFFYRDLVAMFTEQGPQAVLLLSGVTIFLAGFTFSTMVRLRSLQRERLRRLVSMELYRERSKRDETQKEGTE